MEMLYIKYILNLNTLEILKIIKKMDLEQRNIQMALNILVILLIIRKMDMENILFLIKNTMKEILKMIYIMEKDNMYGKKVARNMLVSLKMEKLKERVFIDMKMGRYLEDLLLMDIKMEKVLLNFPMGKNI